MDPYIWKRMRTLQGYRVKGLAIRQRKRQIRLGCEVRLRGKGGEMKERESPRLSGQNTFKSQEQTRRYYWTRQQQRRASGVGNAMHLLWPDVPDDSADHGRNPGGQATIHDEPQRRAEAEARPTQQQYHQGSRGPFHMIRAPASGPRRLCPAPSERTHPSQRTQAKKPPDVASYTHVSLERPALQGRKEGRNNLHPVPAPKAYRPGPSTCVSDVGHRSMARVYGQRPDMHGSKPRCL